MGWFGPVRGGCGLRPGKARLQPAAHPHCAHTRTHTQNPNSSQPTYAHPHPHTHAGGVWRGGHGDGSGGAGAVCARHGAPAAGLGGQHAQVRGWRWRGAAGRRGWLGGGGLALAPVGGAGRRRRGAPSRSQREQQAAHAGPACPWTPSLAALPRPQVPAGAADGADRAGGGQGRLRSRRQGAGGRVWSRLPSEVPVGSSAVSRVARRPWALPADPMPARWAPCLAHALLLLLLLVCCRRGGWRRRRTRTRATWRTCSASWRSSARGTASSPQARGLHAPAARLQRRSQAPVPRALCTPQGQP